MALPTKGTRKLSVDGAEYRWRIRGKPTYDQGAFATPMTFAVEHSEARGTTLVVTTTVPRPDNWLGKPSAPVTPARVAEAIRQALRAGWKPATCGPPFMLRFDMLDCQQDAPPNRRPPRPQEVRTSGRGGGR